MKGLSRPTAIETAGNSEYNSLVLNYFELKHEPNTSTGIPRFVFHDRMLRLFDRNGVTWKSGAEL